MRWIFVAFTALLLLLPVLAIPQQESPSGAAAVLLGCRALETYTDGELKVAAIVFHQRDEAQRSQLAMLLRDHSGEMVEIQAGDGKWRRARMVRLKSCFGRGLLLLTAPAPVSEHADFVLRFPAGSETH
ncbi:MAG: hypothetical protein ABSD98_12770 [Candidatus Korobacteraceae bacterium]|jgi:hypothetical protein